MKADRRVSRGIATLALLIVRALFLNRGIMKAEFFFYYYHDSGGIV